MPKQRLFCLDFVRAAALGCILVVHFNAAVTAYFTLPHRLFASVLPFGIYLGDFGSSLFFMVSGAALALSDKPGQGTVRFYKKRAAAVYPMFWLAWCIFFSARFVLHPGYYAGAKTPTLALTLLGLDNYAVAAGWVVQDFACVGEWFLGSILILYLAFPLLRWGLQKNKALTWAPVLAVCLPVHRLGWDAQLLAVHLLEFLFGMCALALPRRGKAAAAALCAAAFFLVRQWDAKIACALFSAAAFVLLCAASRLLDRPVPRTVCARLAKLSYPLFLVHHVIILHLAEKFDLAALTRRDTALLFFVYLLASFAAAEALLCLDAALRARLAALWAECRRQ